MKTKIYKFKDLGKIITGKTPPTSKLELYGNEYQFITPSDIPTFTERYILSTERGLSKLGYNKMKSIVLPYNSIGVVCIGSTIGKICLTTSECITNQQLNSIIVNKERFDPLYLYYSIRSYIPKIQAITGGTGAGKSILNKTSFEELEIELYEEFGIQQKIAKFLSNYDDLIENNNRCIKILEEMAQKIYKEWFVDFKFPGHETTTFKDSPLGKIPNDWEVKPIEKLLIHQIGGGWGNEIKTDKYNTPAYVIRGADIPNGRQGCIENCPLRYHTSSNLKTRTLNENDIVFEVSGGSKGQPVGRTLILNKNLFNQFKNNVICASFCKLLRVDQTQIIPEYIYLHLLNIYNNGEIEKYQTQSTGIINFKFNFFLENEKILIPEQNIISKFEKIIKPIFDEIFLLGNKNQVLKQTRDILLPRLISGEINVENMEIQ